MLPDAHSHASSQLSLDRIEGLFRKETHSIAQIMDIVGSRHRDVLSYEDVYGTFVTLTRHLPLPVDYVFDYLSRVSSLEEFTLSLRNFLPCSGRPGLWVGEEHFRPGTRIYLRCLAYRESYCVDHPCAWDNSENLWCYYAFRLYDGKRVMDRPGTVVQWSNFRHRNYEEGGPFKELIGAFPRFYEIHGLELDNLTTILKARFRDEYGYLLNEEVPGGF
jgi:hypothetical protein